MTGREQVRAGGLMRCCLASLAEIRKDAPEPPKEGDTVRCTRCTDGQMVFRDGAWEWDRARKTMLYLWTIYDHPADMPDKFVARRFIYDKPTEDVLVSDNLESLRAVFREQGLVKMVRHESDDPKILETWL